MSATNVLPIEISSPAALPSVLLFVPTAIAPTMMNYANCAVIPAVTAATQRR